jgi:hypothetical protein
MRVPDRIGAALCNPGQERLGSERPLDARIRAETVSGYSTHNY